MRGRVLRDQLGERPETAGEDTPAPKRRLAPRKGAPAPGDAPRKTAAPAKAAKPAPTRRAAAGDDGIAALGKAWDRTTRPPRPGGRAAPDAAAKPAAKPAAKSATAPAARTATKSAPKSAERPARTGDARPAAKAAAAKAGAKPASRATAKAAPKAGSKPAPKTAATHGRRPDRSRGRRAAPVGRADPDARGKTRPHSPARTCPKGWHGPRLAARIAPSGPLGGLPPGNAMSESGLRTLSLALLAALVLYVAGSGGM